MKATIAVEALKGQRTIQEIASQLRYPSHQVTQWKKQFVERAGYRFSTGREHAAEAEEQVKAELFTV